MDKMTREEAALALCRLLTALQSKVTNRNRFGKLEPSSQTSEQFRELGRIVEIDSGGEDLLDQIGNIAAKIVQDDEGAIIQPEFAPAHGRCGPR